MFLIIKAITNVPDLVIDFVEVRLQFGKTVSLNWDRSSIDRCDEKFVGEYEDVCFDEESADGKLGELHGMQVTGVGLYIEIIDLDCNGSDPNAEYEAMERLKAVRQCLYKLY